MTGETACPTKIVAARDEIKMAHSFHNDSEITQN
jgi:hypothetical protein